MKGTRKILAVILSLTMLLSLMPAMAFADIEGSDPDAAAAETVTDSTGEVEEQAVQNEDQSADAAEEAIAEEPADGAAEADAAEELVVDEPADANAEDEELADGDEAADEEEIGEAEISFTEGIDPEELEGADPDSLMEKFLYSEDAEEEWTYEDGRAPKAPLSIKGDRLTGNNLKYYNYFKTIITQVSAGSRTETSMQVPVTSITGKSTYTAKSLGLSKFGTVRNGTLYLTSAAQKKINALIAPEDWRKVYTSIVSDFAADSYWVDWYTRQYFYGASWYIKGTSKSITFVKSKSKATIQLAVIPELASSTFRVSSGKISAANTAKAYARSIASTSDSTIAAKYGDTYYENCDYNRLRYYCEEIARLTEYDSVAYETPVNQLYWKGAWSMINVFDRNTSTKTVCVGYAMAFKYLCDLSTFRSDWIDCQVMSGDAMTSNGWEGHMWNLVRMNGGLNYLVDPTWMDLDGTWDGEPYISAIWFLRGAADGTANSYTVNGYLRKYDDWTIATIPAAERTIAKADYQKVADRPIVLPGTKLKKIGKGKKSFKARWIPVTTPVGALYVDGYQIQYSLKKNFRKAKTVTVKGFGQSTKVIKKLKKKKVYYVRIRTYAKVGKHTYYSALSGRKKVKTK